MTGVSATCPFCSIVDGSSPGHIVATDEQWIGFLDRSPLFAGHTLVVPRRHVVTMPDLDDHTLAELFAGVRRIAAAMPAALGCQGTFVAVNNVVSQSVAHLHVHVVPRRFKDGLKGFFWPRTKYRDDAHITEVAAQLRAVLT